MDHPNIDVEIERLGLLHRRLTAASAEYHEAVISVLRRVSAARRKEGFKNDNRKTHKQNKVKGSTHGRNSMEQQSKTRHSGSSGNDVRAVNDLPGSTCDIEPAAYKPMPESFVTSDDDGFQGKDSYEFTDVETQK